MRFTSTQVNSISEVSSMKTSPEVISSVINYHNKGDPRRSARLRGEDFFILFSNLSIHLFIYFSIAGMLNFALKKVMEGNLPKENTTKYDVFTSVWLNTIAAKHEK